MLHSDVLLCGIMRPCLYVYFAVVMLLVSKLSFTTCAEAGATMQEPASLRCVGFSFCALQFCRF